MKRSYNASTAPPNPYGATTASGGYSQPGVAPPPLPAGPPPPAPPQGQAQQYQNYGYAAGYGGPAPLQQQAQQSGGQAQPVMAAHPQYPGYGYGAGAAPAASASPFPQQPQPQTQDPNTAAATAAQYAAYYAAYAQQFAAAGGQQNAMSPYQSATPAANAAPPPPPMQGQYGQTMTPGYPAGSGSGSPGAPPYKRTRYDSNPYGGQPAYSNNAPPPPLPIGQPPLPPGPPPTAPYGAGSAPMPPSILPPVGGRGPPPVRNAGPPPLSSRDGGSRGGYNDGPRGGPGLPPRPDPYARDSRRDDGMYDSRGGPRGPIRDGPRGGGGPIGGPRDRDRDRDRDRYDDYPPPPLPRRGGPPGGGYSNRGGRSPILPPRGAPMGPRGSGPHRHDDYPSPRRGDRGGIPAGPSGRGGPSGGKFGPMGGATGLPSGPRGLPNAPKGPKGASIPNAPSGPSRGGVNSQASRKDRKWGAAGGPSTPASKAASRKDRERDRDRDESNSTSSSKRTLTDFRIEGLGIPELEWEWRASRIEDEMKRIAEELDKQVEEKQAEQNDGAEPKNEEPASDLPATADEKTSVVEDTDAAEPADSTAGAVDMSIEMTEAPSAETDVSEAPVSAAGKHRREEDDEEEASSSAVEDGGPADEHTGGAAQLAQKRSDHASKPKKVRIDDVDHEANLLATAVNDDAANSLEATQDESAAADDAPDGEEVAKDEEAEKANAIEPAGTEADDSKIATEQEEDVDGAPIDAIEEPADKTSPTKPSAAAAPAPARENSRLRIYFMTPVSSSSSYVVPASATQEKESRQSTAPMSEAVKEESSVDDNAAASNDRPPPPEPEPTPVDIKVEEESSADAPALEKVDDKLQEVVAETDTQDESAAGPASETTDGAGHVEAGVTNAEGAVEDDSIGQEDSAAEPAPAGDAASEAEGEARNERDGTVDGVSAEENDKEAATAVETYETTEGTNAPDAPRQASAAPSIAPSVAETTSAPLPPEPAADRISIAYARNTRRMVLDAEVIEAVKIFRGEGRIELVVKCQPAVYGEPDHLLDDDFRVCKGVLLESLDVEADDYIVVDRSMLARAWASQADQPNETDDHHDLLPPLHRLLTSLEVQDPTDISFVHDSFTVAAHLDRVNPLTEARWVKNGEIDQYILSLGIQNGADPKDSSKLSEWRNKIRIVDPDPPPTIQDTLDAWIASSNVGSKPEREKFVKTHMANIDNVVEILLRLTRGDRTTAPPHTYTSAGQQPAAVGALAVTMNAPFADQQTQVSLAVLGMFRLSVETARKAGIEAAEVERQVSDIVRMLPNHLTFKAIDGMFRELVKGQKGGSAVPSAPRSSKKGRRAD